MDDCARNCNKRMASIDAVTESSSASFSKKTKIDFAFEEMTSAPPLKKNLLQLQLDQQQRLFVLSSPEKAVSPATSLNYGGVQAGDVSSDDYAVSRCSSNVSNDAVKDSFRFLDLEAKSFETESSTCIDNKFSRETTPSSEFCGDTDDMDSPTARKTDRGRVAAGRTPPKEEIDDFFAEAEKNEQKRFTEKYNYDIAKDAPLEGRYQWIRLKP